ncbi:hypothetical protein NDU88_004968 [Pleurodeles waltl]|uniref:Uncharacterized protein n=1 Tax=Pleurodeles waltl TaxID=8319 RepID=A0AAV7N2Z4_PLEWA|nr:hypothetical protein NDU88_004968 [Pleurodeles waltl]
MEVEAKVLEAVAHLRQVGRMDLLKDGALAPGHLARRPSAGVAAAVAACSPPRVAGAAKVRGASRGGGAKGVFGNGRLAGRERGRGSQRASREVGHGIPRRSWKPARNGKAGPQEAAWRKGDRNEGVRALEASAAGKPEGGKAGARQARAAVSSEVRKAGGAMGGPGTFSNSMGLSISGRRGKGGAPRVEEARVLDLGARRGEGEKWVSVEKEKRVNRRAGEADLLCYWDVKGGLGWNGICRLAREVTDKELQRSTIARSPVIPGSGF